MARRKQPINYREVNCCFYCNDCEEVECDIYTCTRNTQLKVTRRHAKKYVCDLFNE